MMQRNFALSWVAILTILAFAATLSKVDACWKRRPSCHVSSPLVLTALSPGGTLTLGDDLTVQYRVTPGVTFANIKLRVTNRTGELVYLGANLPAEAGEHQAVWPKGKWNQQPHSGALANPRNGPYTVALVAETQDGGSFSCSIFLPTQLVLECDLEHGKPSKEEISSGLYRSMLDPKSAERLRIGLVQKAGKLAETVYALAPPYFADIIEEDLDNDPSELEIKSAHVRQVMQSAFGNGEYNVVLMNLRTGAGTRGVNGMPEGIIEAWTIMLR
jgi:hypothetical protein